MSPVVALFGAALTGLVTFSGSPLVGRWSDRIGRKPLIFWSRIVLVLSVYPGFLWLNASPTPAVLYTVMGWLSVLLTIQGTPTLTMLPEMFPRHLRASGMSLVYSVGVTIFGGFSPFISTWLVNATGSKFAPAWYLMGMTLASLVGLKLLKDYTGRDIDALQAANA